MMGEYEVREKTQGVLKTYVRARKLEVKSKAQRTKRESKAAETALSALMTLIPTHLNVLLEVLVTEKTIIPADRKMGDSMSGAFLLWSSFLVKFSISFPTFLQALVDRLFTFLNSQWLGNRGAEQDPTKEAMYEWIIYILTSAEWEVVYESSIGGQHVVQTLERCFTAPTSWNLRVAEALLQYEVTPSREQWSELLKAARDEEMEINSMEVDSTVVESKVETEVKKVTEKASGPQKYVGLWKPKPIGVLPIGWEDDEETVP